MESVCRKLTITILLSTLTFLLMHAQGPDTLWTKTYGGDLFDNGSVVQQAADSGFIIIGYTESYGDSSGDLFLIKTNEMGDSLWTKAYGGDLQEYGFFVQQTVDGGYIAVGYTISFGAGGADAWILKTNSSGDTLWTKTYGSNFFDFSCCVQEIGNRYIVVGYKELYGPNGADLWLLKIDSSGDTLWTKTYGGVSDDYGFHLCPASDGGYVVVGETHSFGAGNSDIWVLKIDSLGDTLWTKTYGGIDYDHAYQAVQTVDSGYVITGSTKSFGAGNADAWILKINSVGDTLWTKVYGGGGYDNARSIQPSINSGYIIAGYTNSFGAGGYDVWLLKINSSGDTLWTKTWGGNNSDGSYFIESTVDSGYVMTGWTESFGAGWADVWLLKIAPEPGIEEDKVESVKSGNFGATIFSGSLLLPEGKRCKVYDVTGRTVVPDKMKPGIYFVEVDGQITRKVVKVR